MSTFVELLPREMQTAAAESPAVTAWPEESSTASWSLGSFAKEQIRGLVRQLFVPCSAPLRQVVFSAVDPETEVLPICLQVGKALGQHAPGSVCVVEAVPCRQKRGITPAQAFIASSSAKRFGALRDSSEQLSSGLWFMPADVFWGGNHDFPAVWLRARLAELRLEFDYTVLEGPAATHSETATLGNLCDGLVLVLQANFTRRVPAQKVIQRLSSANAHLLGTVLTGRMFPIPEAIYKRL
jgi:hypothetical protein